MAIVLFSFGKQGYGFAAYNLAVSIRSFSDIPIILYTDGAATSALNDFSVFTEVIRMPREIVTSNDKIDPAKVKVNIYDFIEKLPYDEVLYLDVDALCLKKIDDIFDSFQAGGFYQTDVVGKGSFGDKINYAIWAKQEYIWPFFDLKKEDVYPAIQSSYAYIRKGPEAKKFFDKVKSYFEKGFPLTQILMRWGDTIPDELIFSGTCANQGLIPDSPIRPIFFGWKYDKRSYKELIEKYYLLSIYGNGTSKTLTKMRYWEWYDRMGKKLARAQNRPFYKSIYIKRDKHANA